MRFVRTIKRLFARHKEKMEERTGREMAMKGWAPENEQDLKMKSSLSASAQQHMTMGKGHHMARSIKGHT